jgi:hypothetical protein
MKQRIPLKLERREPFHRTVGSSTMPQKRIRSFARTQCRCCRPVPSSVGPLESIDDRSMKASYDHSHDAASYRPAAIIRGDSPSTILIENLLGPRLDAPVCVVS